MSNQVDTWLRWFGTKANAIEGEVFTPLSWRRVGSEAADARGHDGAKVEVVGSHHIHLHHVGISHRCGITGDNSHQFQVFQLPLAGECCGEMTCKRITTERHFITRGSGDILPDNWRSFDSKCVA